MNTELERLELGHGMVALLVRRSCPKHPDTPINSENGRCPLCILADLASARAAL